MKKKNVAELFFFFFLLIFHLDNAIEPVERTKFIRQDIDSPSKDYHFMNTTSNN